MSEMFPSPAGLLEEDLMKVNLEPGPPARGPLLTTVHKMTRLQFAREHVNWTLDNWKRVLFTDEVRVGQNPPDGLSYKWLIFSANNILKVQNLYKLEIIKKIRVVR
uniref:Transposase Tc1-like domain-containing protein n=1 Tax=Rhodnius prolixus TaxID=13249 RepID=T1HD28_RHOPR